MSAENRPGDNDSGRDSGRDAGGDALEYEFRAMFAERSDTVRMTTAPYAAVRRRIAEGRRRRRLRFGGAGAAFAVAVAGIGVWVAAPDRSGGTASPTTPPHPMVAGSPTLVYADGHTPLPAGTLRDVVLTWLRARYTGDLSGTTVVTTFDPLVQMAADAKVSADDSGVAVVDWHDGDVLALGGTWARPVPVADLMKPIVLAAAFETGRYTPQSKEPLDTQKHPISWPPGARFPMTYYSGGGNKYWPPEAPTTTITDTDVTLTQAAESAANGPFAQLETGDGMTIPAIRDLGVAMGLPKDSQEFLPVPSLVLGTAQASPLTMASVYATIADGGLHQDPRMVRKVLAKDGRTVWTAPQTSARVLSQNTATQLAGVLHAALVSGTTGTAVEPRTSAEPGSWAMAGAPDTDMSAWFDGADGDHVIAVALSKVNADGTAAPLPGDHSGGAAVGSRLAGPIWAGMVQTLRNLK